MPRYHFHTEDGRCFPDPEGTELPDLDAAKREAQTVLGEILQHDEQFWETQHFRLLLSETAKVEDVLYSISVEGHPGR